MKYTKNSGNRTKKGNRIAAIFSVVLVFAILFITQAPAVIAANSAAPAAAVGAAPEAPVPSEAPSAPGSLPPSQEPPAGEEGEGTSSTPPPANPEEEGGQPGTEDPQEPAPPQSEDPAPEEPQEPEELAVTVRVTFTIPAQLRSKVALAPAAPADETDGEEDDATAGEADVADAARPVQAVVEVEEGATLNEGDVPGVEILQEDENALPLELEGWQQAGEEEVLTEEEILGAPITQDTEYVAVFTGGIVPMANGYDPNTRIDQIIVGNETQIAVIPSPDDPTNLTSIKTYGTNEAAIRSALWDLYQKGGGGNFTLYLGTAVTASITAATHMGRNTSTATGTGDVTFASLQGRVGTLALVGSPSDPADESTDPTQSTTTAPGDARRFAFTTDVYFGTGIIMRNIEYNFSDIYMNGNSLTLARGSYETAGATNIYGGARSGDISGNPKMTINSTGAGTFNLYGGNYQGTLTGNIVIEVNAASNTIGSIYGAGQGTNGNNANVIGNVSTIVNGMGRRANADNYLGDVYGGANYGDVSGAIYNHISGNGRNLGTPLFIGGSYRGNVGTDATLGTDVIVNHVDTSAYSSGTARAIAGGQGHSGTIKGNIVNVFAAGRNQALGGFTYVSGGSSLNAPAASRRNINGFTLPSGNINWPAAENNYYNGLTSQQKADDFKQRTSTQTYGNITTTVEKGSVSNGGGDGGYMRGAGWQGYVEGNVLLKVGTEDLVHNLSYPTVNLDLRVSNTAAQSSRGLDHGALDIVAGGGSHGAWETNFFLYGDCQLEQYNVLARWTYGGGFSGVYVGTQRNILYGPTGPNAKGGIVDTLEGGGYTDSRLYGRSEAYVFGGEVDWFLSGGSWDANRVYGDVYVEVWDGIINASMGGTYGNGNNTIYGNSSVNVYGGNFRGVPRTGGNGFSGGATTSGWIMGDTSVTLDLRQQENPTSALGVPVTQGTFVPPLANATITGGRRYNAGILSYLGMSQHEGNADQPSNVTLNIYADETTGDVLNGVSIYGDGGGSATQSNVGKITINIDAPDSVIGTLYATQYSNVTGSATTGKVLRDVEVNLTRANSVQGISGGNSGDNFTNTVAANSRTDGKNVVFNIGGTDEEGNQVTGEISITDSGLVNFFELNSDGIMLMANGGNIKNGGSATADNHAATYDNFGDIHLKNGAGIGATGSNIISGGVLTVEGESNIRSNSGMGIINLSGFEAPAAGDRLVWQRNGGGGRQMYGTWFGSQASGYPVLTFSTNNTGRNPKTEALKITPEKMRGVDVTAANRGKTYIGDNDVDVRTHTTNGYAYALPGSFIEYSVDKLANPDTGEGWAWHNIPNVGNTAPVTGAYGTKLPGEEHKIGHTDPAAILAIPASYSIADVDPILTYRPETTATGSWLKYINSDRSDGEVNIVMEKADSSDGEWNWFGNESNYYSYVVKGAFTNMPEVSARSVIVTESEAKALVDENELKSPTWTNATGRPFFGSDIAENGTVAKIQEGLGEDPNKDSYRVHNITYGAGVTGNNKTITVQVMIVPDDAVLSDDKTAAVHAQDASMTKTEAEALADEAELAQNYTMAIAYTVTTDANGSSTVVISTPSANASCIADIKAVDYTTIVPVTYTHTYTDAAGNEATLTKPVDVEVVDNYVCKIVNGTTETAYETLEEAIDAAHASSQGSVTIQMLVDRYEMAEERTISKGITITTTQDTAASGYDGNFPYKGVNTRAIVGHLANATPNPLFTVAAGATFSFENLELQGTRLSTTEPDSAVLVSAGATFNIDADSAIANFQSDGPIVDNNGTFNLAGTVKSNRTTMRNQAGIIGNKGTMNMVATAHITDNQAYYYGGGIYNAEGATLNMNGGTITGNRVSDGVDSGGSGNPGGGLNPGGESGTGTEVAGLGGGVYQNGTMNIQGKVVINGNQRVELTQGGGAVGGEDPVPVPIHADNVYLPATSVTAPLQKVVTVVADLAQDSAVYVMTNTSPLEADMGTQYTIIAVPGSGYTNIQNMEEYFSHDQLSRNPDAYHVVWDLRNGGTNLILNYADALPFAFTKVNAANFDDTLQDAVFHLYYCPHEGEAGHVHADLVTDALLEAGTCWQPMQNAAGDAPQEYTSNASGLVDFGVLLNGSYMLVETEAPDGYERPMGQWLIQVDNTKTGQEQIKLTAKGNRLPPAFVRQYVDESDPTLGETFLLPNMIPFEIPKAGSIGTYPFFALGIALMLFAVTFILLNQRKSNKDKKVSKYADGGEVS